MLLQQTYGPLSAIKDGHLPAALGSPVPEFPAHTAARAALAGGLPYAGMPAQGKMIQEARREAKRASAKQAASKWTSLGRWAASYGLSMAGDEIAQLAGEGSYAGQAIGSMSRIGGMATAGGAIGMAAGPLGAAAGFAGGAALGAIKELVSALNANTDAEKQMIAI